MGKNDMSTDISDISTNIYIYIYVCIRDGHIKQK